MKQSRNIYILNSVLSIMINKKSLGVVFTFLVFVSFFAFVVSAQDLIGPPAPSSNPIERFFESFGSDIKDFVNNGLNYKENNILVTFLLGFLVFMIVAAIVNSMPLFAKHSVFPYQVSVALAVTILSVLFIPREVLRLAVNPYSAFGLAVITILPFIFMFTFVFASIRNTFLRHAAWLIFALAFVVLGFYNLAEGSGSKSSYSWWYSLIYFAVSIVCVIMIWGGEWIEERRFRGAVDAGRLGAEDYLNKRKLLMEFDKKRAAVELGIDEDKVGRKKL